MSKNTKTFLSLLLCVVLVVPVFFSMKKHGTNAAESKLLIRFGIFYSSTARATIEVASMSGGSAGIIQNNIYVPVADFTSSQIVTGEKKSGSCVYIGEEYSSLDSCNKALDKLEEFVANGGVTPSPTPSPSPTPTLEPTQTPTQEPEVTPTEGPSQEPELTPTEGPSQEPEGTPEITPEVTPTEDPSQEPEVTPEITPGVTPELTPEVTPEVTATFSPDPTELTSDEGNVPMLLSTVTMPDIFYVYDGTSWLIGTQSVSDELQEILDGTYAVKEHTFGRNSVEIFFNGKSQYVLSTGDKLAKVRIEPAEPQTGSEHPAVLEIKTDSSNSSYYRGAFELHRQSGGNINLINVIDIEHYLYGVVPSEMYAGSVSQYDERKEGLKSQAILARSVAYKNVVYDGMNSYDVNITTSDQAYHGYMVVGKSSKRIYETANTTRAVDETRDLVLFYNGEPIRSVLYSDNNGGYTEDISKVWGGSPDDYYKVAKDKWTIASDTDHWTVEFTGKTYNEKVVSVVGSSIGKVNYIRVIERSESGRITKTEIVGTDNTTTVLRGNNRGLLGLKSQLYNYAVSDRLEPLYTETAVDKTLTPMAEYIFEGGYYTISYVGDQYAVIGDDGLQYEKIKVYPMSETQAISVSGSGYGHGVGMSQDGAAYASKNGVPCEEILAFYYPGTKIQNLYGE